jgi:putative spermidine/putrescine transport system substrate-binding protein
MKIRTFLVFAVGLASATGWLNISYAQQKLYIDGSGGAVQAAYEEVFFRPFEKETGITIVYTATPSNTRWPKTEQMVKTGNVEWDIIEADNEWVIIGGNKGLFEPIDYSVVSTKDLEQSGIHKYGMAKGFYSLVLAYNTKTYPSAKPHPQSWQDFWDVKKFPGPRSLRNNPRDNLEFALLADGVPMEKLYPLDVNRAFKSMDKIKAHITVWWDSGAQPAQLLANGEVVMASAWNGRIFPLTQEGAPVDLEWNQGSINFTYWSVLKNSKNKSNAMKFLKYFNEDPKRQARYCEKVTYPGLNKKMYDYVDPKMVKHINMSPQNAKKQFIYNVNWWVENLDKVTERWNTWMLK